MHVYDTLIIGCGYAPIGYALANKNVIIVEEHQTCDTAFYMPLSCYNYIPYTPKSQYGLQLKNIFDQLKLFSNSQQNVNGFECALCKFIVDNPIDILLKCRVVSVSQLKDGVFDVSIYTNQGITHIFAKNIINTVQKTINKVMTVLFTSNDIDKDSALLRSVFKTVAIEPAFYDGRYALRINVNDYDENSAKLFIYNNWRKLDTQAKIVYIAPTFLREKSNVSLNDANYDNPICALDAGYFYGKGGHNDTI